MLDSSLIFAVAIVVLDVLVFSYATYWAFAIGKSLVSPLYRRQALWVGAIGIYFTAFFLFIGLAQTLGINFTDNIASSIAVGAFIYVGVVTFFVWIDSTIRVARRSDPLRRNTLKWSGLRWVFGFFVFVGTFFGLVFNSTQALNAVQSTPLYGTIGIVLLLGSIALIKGGRRSADLVLKAHLRWFGLFAAFLWGTIGSIGPLHTAIGDPTVEVVSGTLFAVAAYFLYRTARSLVPIAQLPSIAPEVLPATLA
jgi:hypothetical protein